MSTLPVSVPPRSLVAETPLSRPRRASAAAAATLALAGVGAAAGVAPGPDVALTAAAGVGAVLALLFGAASSDRRGRRRFVAVGLALLAASAVLLFVPAVSVLAGLALGIGAVMTVMAAAAWLVDAGVRGAASIVAGLTAAAAGVAASVALGLVGLVVALALAAVAVATGAESVRGARTPAFVVPGLPAVVGRPAGVPVLMLLALAFALRHFGPVGAGIVAGTLVLVAVLAVSGRRRVREGTALAPARTRTYRRATASFDATAVPAPALAGIVTTVDEVRAAVGAARAAGLGVTMQSTGHAAVSLGDLRHDALLRVAMSGRVEVDAERRLVRVPAGSSWGDAVPVLAPHGLAVPHGSSGHVGVVGYLTRGGLSAYGRHTGVAANHLESVELVLADGSEVTASRDAASELFWAVRGGGGGFGVVTAVTVRAFVPGEVVTGTTAWELTDAAAVGRAWAEWSASAPSAITTSLRVLAVPPFPGMPLRLTRRPLLVIDGTAVDGDVPARTAVDDLLGRLRAVARPVLDTWRSADPNEVPFTHMDPPVSPAHASQHAMLGTGPAGDVDQAVAIVDAFLADATRADTGLAIAELRQLGGALATPAPDGGAVSHFRGAFGWFAVALHGRAGRVAAEARIDHAWDTLSPWSTGFTVPTLAAERGRPARSFPAETARRVAAVRAGVDPLGVFATDVLPAALPH